MACSFSTTIPTPPPSSAREVGGSSAFAIGAVWQIARRTITALTVRPRLSSARHRVACDRARESTIVGVTYGWPVHPGRREAFELLVMLRSLLAPGRMVAGRSLTAR